VRVAAEQIDVEVAVVGAGGAGLSLVIAVERAARLAGVPAPSILVVDPVHRRVADRTWCWWASPSGGTGLDDETGLDGMLALAHRSWPRMELVDRAGGSRVYELGAQRYVMLRSSDFYAAADAALARLIERDRTAPGQTGSDRPGSGVVEPGRVTGAVDRIQDGPERAVVQVGDLGIQARWVFDSRPAAPSRPGSTLLLQHFRGWTVRFERPVLDPELATLMDFRVPQPEHAVAFGYCLPLDAQRALVEYTEFGRSRLRSEGYDRALSGYLRQRWDVEPGRGVEIEAVEDGVIPMTDAPFPRRVGARVFRLGTAGGATRASTGYTFVAMQRQASAVAGLLLAGRTPMPPPAYPARHRWLDAVLLRALDHGYVPGPELFTGLFADHPSDRVVRFLDGLSGPIEELAMMRSAPMPAMIRATAEDAAARVGRWTQSHWRD
jgi:lycopene beta-cyclase